MQPLPSESQRPHLINLDRSDPELRNAWLLLACLESEIGSDTTALDPEMHEVWQYMGTVATVDRFRDRYVHEFRHRNHPQSQEAQSVSFPATIGWLPNQPHPPLLRKRWIAKLRLLWAIAQTLFA